MSSVVKATVLHDSTSTTTTPTHCIPDIPTLPDHHHALAMDFSAFTRLDPVPTQESAIYDVLTRRPIYLNPLAYKDDSDSNTSSSSSSSNSSSSVSSSSSPIYPHELCPITQPLSLRHEIPEEVWSDEFRFDATMKYWGSLFDGYERISTSGTYVTTILHNQPDSNWRIHGCLDLFGLEHNALTPVIQLASLLPNKYACDMIMHSISMICLQYYMMERDRFLMVHTNEHEQHQASKHPYLFLLFPRYDIKRNPYAAPSCIPATEWVHRYDFSSLVYNVATALVPLIPQRMLTEPDVNSWCVNKMFNNQKLFLVTSRFMHVHVRNYAKAVRDSVVSKTNMASLCDTHPIISDDEPVKSFASPNRMWLLPVRFDDTPPFNNSPETPDCPMRSAAAAHNSLRELQAKIPVPHCHFFFGPTRPVLIIPSTVIPSSLQVGMPMETVINTCESWDKVLFEMAKHVDKSLVDEIQKHLNTVFTLWKRKCHKADPSATILNSRARSYPDVDEIDLLRVAYSYILRDNQLWTGIAPHLHCSSNKAHSQSSPLFIDIPTWKWMCARAKTRRIQFDGITLVLPNKPEDDSDTYTNRYGWWIHSKLHNASFTEACVITCAEVFYEHLYDYSSLNRFLLLHAIIAHGFKEEDAIAWMLQQQLLTEETGRIHLQDDYKVYYHDVTHRYNELIKSSSFANLKAIIRRAHLSWGKDNHQSISIPNRKQWLGIFQPTTMWNLLPNIAPIHQIHIRKNKDSAPVTEHVLIYQMLKYMTSMDEINNEFMVEAQYAKAMIQVENEIVTPQQFAAEFLTHIYEIYAIVHGYWIWHLPVLIVKANPNPQSVQLIRMQRNFPVSTDLLYQVVKDLRAKSFIEEVQRVQGDIKAKSELANTLFESLIHIATGVEKWVGNNNINNNEDKLCDTLRILCDNKANLDVNKMNCKEKCTHIFYTTLTLKPKAVTEAINHIVDVMIPYFTSEEIPNVIADIILNATGTHEIALKSYVEDCKRSCTETAAFIHSREDGHLRRLIGRSLLKRKRTCRGN